MIWPFEFPSSSATAVLVITDETSTGNQILYGLRNASTLTDAQRQVFETLGQNLLFGWLKELTVSVDKDCHLQFGIYDGTNFYAVYPMQFLAAGSSMQTPKFNTGLYCPLGGALLPAIKIIAGTSVTICGHCEIIPDIARRDDAPLVAGNGTATDPAPIE